MKSFLLIGQSNMCGRGFVGDVPEIRNMRCFVLRNGHWSVMTEPIHVDAPVFGDLYGDLRSGVCLAASFADAFQRHFGGDVGLIPCAVGGSSITLWQPGETAYDNAVFQTRLAMRSSEFAGILFHQGCQDTGDAESARGHKDLARIALTAMRQELGAEQEPLLIGGLGSFRGGLLPVLEPVETGLRKLADELPKTAFVSAEGLTRNPDGVHLDSRSLREFGLRYFEAYCRIAGNTTEGRQ